MEILFEDDSLIVINKPAGLLTIQDGYNPNLPTVKKVLEKVYGKIWIVHRLDKDTSGALIVARNAEVHKYLNSCFQERKISKTYHAVVRGHFEFDSFEIDSPLLINGDRKHRTVIDPLKGKTAKTSFTIIEKYRKHSLITASPHSGYTHQIRAHLSWNNHPIVGDVLYNGSFRFPDTFFNINRTALHAFLISLPHPVTRQILTIQAEYPQDICNLLFELRKNYPESTG